MAGIVMLATLGLMGLTDIHQLNGLKNWGAICFNGVAVGTFVWSGLVNWPVALVVAAGALLGGWSGAKLAQRLPREHVRTLIGVIGLATAGWLFLRELSRSTRSTRILDVSGLCCSASRANALRVRAQLTDNRLGSLRLRSLPHICTLG